MKPIYVLALHGVRTGGPEACHQLSDALIEQGFDARTVYYDLGQIRDVMHVPHAERSKQGGLAFGLRENTISEFERYKTKPVAGAPDHENAIVVLPESVANLAAFYTKATVLVWWLSVDNAFGALALGDGRDEKGPLYGGINLNLLRRANVRHAWQSRYAWEFIKALDFTDVGPLSDYTVDLTEYATPLPMSERPKLVAFATGWKVTADLDAIIAQVREIDPEIDCMKIESLSRKGMAAVFARARVYVDLGCFPGKDRGPREAASMNCRPLVLDAGAGSVDLVDWSTDGLGIAARIVREVAKQDEWNWAAGYCGERDDFLFEVSDMFGDEGEDALCGEP